MDKMKDLELLKERQRRFDEVASRLKFDELPIKLKK
jgi:hypothetical protein